MMTEQTRTPPKLEAVFFLSEVIGRRVVLNGKKVGRLSDLIIVDGDKAAEVTHIVVQRSFGYPSLLIPWAKVLSMGDVITVDLATIEEY
jgi:magnesium transporter